MPRAIMPEEASDAGQLTLEHVGAFGDRFAAAGAAPDEVAGALERFRKQDAPALFARFAKNRTWFTPTLIVSKSAIHLGDHRPDGRDQYVSASCKKITEELLKRPSYRSLIGPDAVARQERDYRQLPPLVKLMRDSGVGLLAGTDCAVSIICPGFSLHDELELLVTGGLTPMQALLAATANPARVVGREDLGRIKTGNLADLVLLRTDPLQDVRNTRGIQAVVSRGRLFNRAELDGMLADAAEEAART
jgi:imidazolonepropionase-like amidohydrolase